MRGFSLLELMVAAAILAVVTAVALPMYDTYRARGQRTAAQADLLGCAQGMERHANVTMTYRGAVDTTGDGSGDADTGPASANLCAANTTAYAIVVQLATSGRFVLRARPLDGERAGALELHSSGGRFWDRNKDGDFDDEGEASWR